MKFYTDKQTLHDLGFSSLGRKTSIKQLFNQSKTRGGGEFLEDIMAHPLSNAAAIAARVQTLDYFLTREIVFPFDGMQLDAASSYLQQIDERTRLTELVEDQASAFNKFLGMDSQTKLLVEGAKALLEVFASLRSFLAQVDQTDAYFKSILGDMAIVFQQFDGKELPVAGEKISFSALASYDQQYRFEHRSAVQKVFYHIHQLDAWITVARVAKERGFVLPSVEEPAQVNHMQLDIKGLHHPLVPQAIANDVHMGQDNVLFLTGANMAGKSTFMKSLGMTVYLAHLGFPVPAQSMRFTPFEGLLSSINLSDNMDMGYSHFYAEVKRIRMVAQLLADGKRLFVLFDELFRGTNVKDAYEGTVELTKAFAHKKDSAFVISTHIIEATDDLKAASDGIQYVYLPTVMEGSKPRYTYRLTQGVTADRHGMLIINNEGILDRLSHADRQQAAPQVSRFMTDEQTLKDLALLGKFDPKSIFFLFNRTRTRGGERLLEKWFNEPLLDPQAINERAAALRYFTEHGLALELQEDDFSRFEEYISSSKPISRLTTAVSIFIHKAGEQILKDEKFEELKSHIIASLNVLHNLQSYVKAQLQQDDKSAFAPQLNWAKALLGQLEKEGLLKHVGRNNLSWKEVAGANYQLAGKTSELLELIDLVHTLDVYQSVASLAKERGFTYAHALAKEADCLFIEDGRHPKLKKGVGNNFHMEGSQNLIFLTGANMAGKSTYMKTASINLYLAHMGFPVAASSMRFSVRDGLYTSINVSDSLQQGFSHYYAEVMRVKAIAEEVAQGKYLFVLFDELFKGTNVKDAFDATLAVTKNFVSFKRTFFIISTHIVEVGEEMAKENDDIVFKYMPTLMNNHIPVYPYKAADGISADKHGMVIIRNEEILELLK